MKKTSSKLVFYLMTGIYIITLVYACTCIWKG